MSHKINSMPQFIWFLHRRNLSKSGCISSLSRWESRHVLTWQRPTKSYLEITVLLDSIHHGFIPLLDVCWRWIGHMVCYFIKSEYFLTESRVLDHDSLGYVWETHSWHNQYSSSQYNSTSTCNPKPNLARHDTSFSSRHTISSKEDFGTQRIQAFICNPTNSQLLHHHSSTKESVTEHERNMKSHLDGFDAKVSGYEKWTIRRSTLYTQ